MRPSTSQRAEQHGTKEVRQLSCDQNRKRHRSPRLCCNLMVGRRKAAEASSCSPSEVRWSLYVVSSPSFVTKTSLLCTWVHVKPVCTEDLCSGGRRGAEEKVTEWNDSTVEEENINLPQLLYTATHNTELVRSHDLKTERNTLNRP